MSSECQRKLSTSSQCPDKDHLDDNKPQACPGDFKKAEDKNDAADNIFYAHNNESSSGSNANTCPITGKDLSCNTEPDDSSDRSSGGAPVDTDVNTDANTEPDDSSDRSGGGAPVDTDVNTDANTDANTDVNTDARTDNDRTTKTEDTFVQHERHHSGQDQDHEDTVLGSILSSLGVGYKKKESDASSEQ